jgi:type I restriction enzyme, S subunit
MFEPTDETQDQEPDSLPDGFSCFSIQDLGDVLNNRRVPLSSLERAKRQGQYPYYGASGVVDYLDGYLFEGEHVLISEDGENLRTRKTPIAFKASGKFWVNNHAHIVKCRSAALTDLLIYYFSNLDLNEYISGAAQPKLNKANLLSIPIRLPSDEREQERLAGALRSIDDKIDLLRCQNQTLEAMAETLFRQWFLEAPSDDWVEYSVSDFADLLKQGVEPGAEPEAAFLHYSLPAFDNGQRPATELGSDILSNKFRVSEGVLLVSKLNPRVSRVWPVHKLPPDANAVCSTEFQVLKPKRPVWFGYLYGLLTSADARDALTMAASGTSGSHQRVRPEDILAIKTSLPDLAMAEQFSDWVAPVLSKRRHNLESIAELEQLRDALLPKLMSGEIRVAG